MELTWRPVGPRGDWVPPPLLHIPGILGDVFDPNKQKPLHGHVVTFALAEAGQNIFCH